MEQVPDLHLGELATPLVDALHNVWEGYFGAPVPPGATNWNAYTHEQLYQMLWTNADPADVAAVSEEWGRHGTELRGHADSLREQRDALRANWSGQAAELASDRIGALGERAADSGARAGTVQQAAGSAGEALATARSSMPRPPGDPTGLALASGLAGAAAGAAVGGVVGAGAAGVGAAPGAAIGAAVGAVAGAGGSMFLANVAAAERKAEAVHVMQRYEQSLASSGQAIAPAAARSSTVDSQQGAVAETGLAGYAGGGGSAGGGGVPWRQLVGASPLGAGQLGAGPAAGFGGAFERALLARAGAPPGPVGASGGMPPGGARGRGEREEQHRNRMPTVDNQLFALDEQVTNPVIGLAPDRGES
ncbi:WXG100 family type VII secretion target [Kutzneria albida]|uniref:PPE family domain-containing protein n=1 Tax=Kutzneria albida DSM 43870 TaxID=1449976 RepID=W5WEV3_9PSEU|nr:hypothetical protein [Kutzneria albida]AHH99290.1 hypothetical protein KALB_5929 [Kutzneria albida DSM 43870]